MERELIPSEERFLDFRWRETRAGRKDPEPQQ